MKTMGIKEIDCTYTKEIICPYCGYEFSDSWEYNRRMEGGDSTELECPECDKKFTATMDIEITYKSHKRK